MENPASSAVESQVPLTWPETYPLLLWKRLHDCYKQQTESAVYSPVTSSFEGRSWPHVNAVGLGVKVTNSGNITMRLVVRLSFLNLRAFADALSAYRAIWNHISLW